MTSDYESKVTANVDSGTYNAVAKNFHYGQQSIFFRKLFTSLKKLIDEGKWNAIIDYMYNGTDLTLPGK